MDTRTATRAQHTGAFDASIPDGASALATTEPAIELTAGLRAREELKNGRFELVIERSAAARVRAMLWPATLLLLAVALLIGAGGLLFVGLGRIGTILSLLTLAAIAVEYARRNTIDALEGGRFRIDERAFSVESVTMTPRDDRPSAISTDELFGFCAIPSGASFSLCAITRDGEVLTVRSSLSTPVVVSHVVDQLNTALRNLRAARSYR